MKKFVCTVCGYVYEGEAAPAECPVCHAPASKFKEQKADELGAWDFMKKVKAQGRAKHIGFSFHDTAEALEHILQNHPDVTVIVDRGAASKL